MKITEDNQINFILLAVGAFLGFALGWAINSIWFVFGALILGWGDSAPDWYFKIQGTIQTAIFVVFSIVGIVGIQFFWKRAQRNKKGLAQHPVRPDRD